FLSGCEGCMRRMPVEEVTLSDWPSCASAGQEELLAARELVAGPNMLEKSVVERYSLHERGGCIIGRAFVRWKLGDTALEVVWNEDLVPLAAYKRMTYPGDANLFDERAYQMTDESTLMVR